MKITALSLFILFTTHLFSQQIYTSDNKYLGNKDEFVSSCIKGAQEKTVNLKGVEINIKQYCSCICDNLIPTLHSKEIEQATSKEKLAELFLNDKNIQIIIDCVDGNFVVEDSFEFKKDNQTEETKLIQVKQCVDEILKIEDDFIWTNQMANEYCLCAIDKLYSKGYTFKDLLEIENENSETFNEIAVPCVAAVLDIKKDIPYSNSYNKEDITGPTSSTIQLIDYLGQGYKIKLSIDGINKYFLFDTGASDLVINREIERELLINGSLNKQHYVGKQLYTLANNEQVMADIVLLNNISIGNYTVNQVYVAVMEKGALLCGKGFLDKFKNWEFNDQKKEITLFK